MGANSAHSPIVVSINFPFYSESHDLPDGLGQYDIEYVVTEHQPLEIIDGTGTIHFCGDIEWIENRAREIVIDSRGNANATDGVLYVYEVWNDADPEQLNKAFARGWITHQLLIRDEDGTDLDLLLVEKSVECEFRLDVKIR